MMVWNGNIDRKKAEVDDALGHGLECVPVRTIFKIGGVKV